MIVTEAAKEIRKELKDSFPGVKFSVRSSKGSIRVEWTDGTTTKEVKAITGKHEVVHYCEYTQEILLGANLFISCNRNISDELKSWATGILDSIEFGWEMSKWEREEEIYKITELNSDYLAEDISWKLEKALEKLASEVVEVVAEVEATEPQEEGIAATKATSEDANQETLTQVLEFRRSIREEKLEAKASRYEELVHKHSKLSNDRYQSAKRIGDMIPFGQPILVGHHSERRHRADIKRIDNNMRKSIEHDKTAKYYQSKLAAMEGNTAISSDDPDALKKLREKLSDLEESQDYMKRINASIRKVSKLETLEEKVAKLCELEPISTVHAHELLTPDFVGRVGFADYQLQNNNANIRRVKERISEIEKQHKAILENGESCDKEYPELGIKVVENFVLNRIQMVFDGKPSEEVRTILKRNGFKWSRYEMAWQRQLNHDGRNSVDWVIKQLQPSA